MNGHGEATSVDALDNFREVIWHTNAMRGWWTAGSAFKATAVNFLLWKQQRERSEMIRGRTPPVKQDLPSPGS